MKSELGWDRVLKIKQVLTPKVPSAVHLLHKGEGLPSGRTVKPALYFVGREGTSEAAFLRP